MRLPDSEATGIYRIFNTKDMKFYLGSASKSFRQQDAQPDSNEQSA